MKTSNLDENDNEDNGNDPIPNSNNNTEHNQKSDDNQDLDKDASNFEDIENQDELLDDDEGKEFGEEENDFDENDLDENDLDNEGRAEQEYEKEVEVSVRQTIKHAHRGSTQIGEVTNNYYVSETFKWLETPPDLIEKNNSVFVQGAKTKLSTRLSDHRIIIINDDVHSGRYSLALSIAKNLAKLPNNKVIITLKCLVDTSILSILLDKNIPADAIFIVRNAFENPGVFLRDFQESCSVIVRLLKQSGSYIILTNSQKGIELPSDIHPIQGTGITAENLIQIFNRHITFSGYMLKEKLISFLKKDQKIVKELIDVLRHPYYIDDFARSLADAQDDIEISNETLIEMAKQVSKPELKLKNWFDELLDIEMYFAFTVALFPDLRKIDLIKRFESDTEKLRQSKTRLEQPRDYGLQHYLEKAACRLSDWDTIEFEDSRCFAYTLTQLRTNYFFHYSGLRNEYAKEITNHVAKNQIETRVSYARALGELGKSDIGELKLILSSLGKSDIMSIRASTGYCLKQLYSDISSHMDIKSLLLEWAQGNEPSLKWTSIATGEKLYWEFPDTVLNIIDRLATDWRNTSAITHALIKISRIEQEKVSDIISKWLDESETQNNNVLRRTATKSAYALFDDLRAGNMVRKQSLMPLAKRLLYLSETHCQKTINKIQNWILQDPKSNWDDVSNLLADILASYNYTVSSIVISNLEKNWLQHDNPTLQKLAKELLEYHGAVVTNSTSNQIPSGLVLVDISNNSGQVIKFSKDLQKKISWAMVSMQPIGISEFLNTEVILWASRGYKPARLIGPLLEKKNVDEFSFLLIITVGEIIDLADWIDTPWKEKIVVCNFGADISMLPGIYYLKSASVEQTALLLQSIIHTKYPRD